VISFGPEALDGALSWISCDVMGVTGGYAARPLRIKSRSCGPLCGQKLSVKECPRSVVVSTGLMRTWPRSKACPLKSRHLSSRSRDRTSVVLRKIKAPSCRAVGFAERITERRSQRRCCGVMRGTQPTALFFRSRLLSCRSGMRGSAQQQGCALLATKARHYRSSRAVLAAASANIAFNCDLVSSLGCLTTGFRVDTTL
jgi:hypothetical protein